MTVYLDILLLTNFWADHALLRTAAHLTEAPLRTARALLGSAVGAVSALMILLPPLPFPLPVLMRAAAACLMCGTAFGFLPVRRLMRQTGAVFLTGAFFCGIVRLISQIRHPACLLMQNGVLYADISLLTLLFAVSAAAAISAFLTNQRRRTPSGGYRLHLRIGETDLSLPAFADSGNLLRDAYTGKPVIVCGTALLAPWLSAFPDPDAAAASRPGFRLLPVQTVSGTAILPAFSPEFAAIIRQTRPNLETPVDVLIALSSQDTGTAVIPACCAR